MLRITKVYVIDENGDKSESIFIHNDSDFHLFIDCSTFHVRTNVTKFEFVSGTPILTL